MITCWTRWCLAQRPYNADMGPLLYAAVQVKSLEAQLAREHTLSATTLMQRAGDALLRCIRANWPEARRILVVVGPGNNGGDGYVLAQRLAHCPNVAVTVIALEPPRSVEAIAQAEASREIAGEALAWQPGDSLPPADLIVDALFGAGLSRPLDADSRALVDRINGHGAPVLAVDVPSGMHADTGSDDGCVVRATRTLTLLARKRGLHTGGGVENAGAVAFDDLGTGTAIDAIERTSSAYRAVTDAAIDFGSPDITPVHSHARLLDMGDLTSLLPPRRRSAHKGDHGHALIIGGEAGMTGAARLSGYAALRTGAGWVSVATRDAHAGMLGLAHPELMAHGVEEPGALSPLLARAHALAIGPGLGQSDWARGLFDAAVAAPMPRVLDADALNLLAIAPRQLDATVVLTPHPGEAARLLGRTTRAIERDRFASARELAMRFGSVIVLKGAGTLIDDGRRCVVCPYGNPGMASAGMGDALTGIIVAFMAQRFDAWNAAVAGVLAHALAGDLAARAGERGLLASDVIDALPRVVNP